ncbi:MAG: bifunctional aspartate kinase/homoserine dehydrogenase I, partial [Flavisolibacter sp.]
MQVLKFGGTSVANAENIRKVRAIVGERMKNDRTIVVVSAFGGVTDHLLQCGIQASEGNADYKQSLQKIANHSLNTVKELLPVTGQSSILSFVMQQFNEIEDICNGLFLLNEFSDRTRDRILSYGELISSRVISEFFIADGLHNSWTDARKLIITDSHFKKASVQFEITHPKINEYFAAATDSLFIVPGFIAADEKGNTTTLGRGGSDYTAAILGAAVNASVVEIWTDVSGMMTADPRLVNNARVIPHISYQEAMELSHFGAKVVYPPTMQPVMQLNIPILIKNTFKPEDHGTVIEAIVSHHNGTIRGISSINHIALLSLEGSGMIGIPGFSKRLFEALSNHSINVILITQASSEHSICVAVEENNAAKSKEIVDRTFEYEITRGLVNPMVLEKDLAILAVVGDNMKSHTGTSGKMFGVLGRNGINIRAIAQGSSERNISAVIAFTDVKKAINVLHEEFFETTYKQVNLFIVGTGNVGSKLLKQLHQQQKYLQKHLRLQMNVVGLANSRKMLFKDEGIDLKNVEATMDQPEVMNLEEFVDRIQKKNLRNAVFVDVTANDKVALKYIDLFSKSISVVACNKIACSSKFEHYKQLKDTSRDHNASFFFETNVGAGLPVIGTLNDLLRSGDVVTEIQAVLSGTLNFVFNNYDGTRSFAT